jgi:hypothetical protein
MSKPESVTTLKQYLDKRISLLRVFTKTPKQIAEDYMAAKRDERNGS